MSGTSTLRIPADMAVEMSLVGDLSDDYQQPIHVAGTSENPDDFCLAFYAEKGSNSLIENHRATLIAKAASGSDREADYPVIVGDVLLVGDSRLATRILEHDQESRREKQSVAAFRAWLLDYSEANSVDAAEVFAHVASYVAHVAHETMEAARHDHATHIAALLGLDPEQVGVFYV